MPRSCRACPRPKGAACDERRARVRSSGSSAIRGSSVSCRPTRNWSGSPAAGCGPKGRSTFRARTPSSGATSGATSSTAGPRPSGVTDLYRPSDFANGHTLDHDGRVLACEHGPRRVARYEADGSRTTMVDRYEGRRLNSPNDLVVASDGAIWFTDPPYGILDDREGYKADSELGGCFVFRLDRATGELTIASDFLDPPERPGVLARRADALRLGHLDRAGRGREPPHRRVRCHRWAPARAAAGLPRHGDGPVGRLPGRRRGQHLDLGRRRHPRPRRPTPPSSGGSSCPSKRATAPSAARTAGGCSSPPPRPSGRSRSGSAAR